MTQKQLAERMGISQQAVQKFERYDADPRLSTLRRYANAVGALVFHEVEADKGQLIDLCEASPWEDSAASVRFIWTANTSTWQSPIFADWASPNTAFIAALRTGA